MTARRSSISLRREARSLGGKGAFSHVVQATRYTFITPYYAGSVLYDKANLWVGAEFERDGSKVQYQLEA